MPEPRPAVTSASAARAVVPRSASTVVLLRSGPGGPEALLTRRPTTMAFGPGLHVFPGGALEPHDGHPRVIGRMVDAHGPDRPTLTASIHTHGGPYALAAIRELYEEVGVLLATRSDGRPVPPGAIAPAGGDGARPAFEDVIAAHDLILRADWLVPMSRWVTPPPSARRFDARFFVAWLPDGAVVDPDPGEVASFVWLRPADALAEMAAGRIDLWPPTSTTLRQLARARDLEDVRRYLVPLGPAPRPATRRIAAGVVRIRFGAAGAIDGQTADGYLVGRRRAVVVDPGDPSDEAAEAITRAADAAGTRIAGILLTSAVPDLAAGAESLAIRLSVPILASTDARPTLSSEVEAIGDGDVIQVADVPIHAHATPGRDPDGLSFSAPSLGVVLVGGLFGPDPTRSIPEPVDGGARRRSRALVRSMGLRRLAAHAAGARRASG